MNHESSISFTLKEESTSISLWCATLSMAGGDKSKNILITLSLWSTELNLQNISTNLKSNTIGPIHYSLHGLEVKCKRGFASPNFASIIKDIFHFRELWTLWDGPSRKMAAWVRDRLSWQPYYFTSLPTQCLTWSSIHLLSIILLFLGWKCFFF